MEMRKTHQQASSYGASTYFATFVLCIFIFGLQLSGLVPHKSLALANELAQSPPPQSTNEPGAPANPAPVLTLRGTVQKGQSAVTIFRQAGVDAAQVMAMHQAVRDVYNLNRLSVGHAYSIRFSPDGQVRSFTYELDAQRRFEILRQQDTYVGRIQTLPHKRTQRVVAGRITETIYAALTAQGESPRLINDFAEIFAWSIDFATDLRPGDTYRLLIEEHQYEGQDPKYQRIMAAELVNRNRRIQTVYYQQDQVEGYYQPDGRSMRSLFLRSPLQYTRISSRFSYNRFHPILKRRRPHLGVDLAAPLGTPVRTIGDGKVIWAGNKGPNGKMVKIKHNKTYTSYYLHLDKYAKGIRVGTRVKQGQVIGYVGSTGLSTGPHLDFRVSQNGQYINPLKQKNLAAPPLPQALLPKFKSYSRGLIKKLDQVQLAMQQDAATKVTK